MFIKTPSTDFFSLLQVVGNGIAWHTKLANYQNRKVYSKSSYTFPKSALTLVRKKKNFRTEIISCNYQKNIFSKQKISYTCLKKRISCTYVKKLKCFLSDVSSICLWYFSFFHILHFSLFSTTHIFFLKATWLLQPGTKHTKTFSLFSTISLHHKWHRTRLLSPQSECTNYLTSCRMTSAGQTFVPTQEKKKTQDRRTLGNFKKTYEMLGFNARLVSNS